jgi:hypothetical protein
LFLRFPALFDQLLVEGFGLLMIQALRVEQQPALPDATINGTQPKGR